MIKAIIFDFFGVLALRDSASFRQTYYPDDEQKTSKTKNLQDDLGRGLMSYDEYIEGLAKIGRVSKDKVLKHTEEFQSNIELLEYVHNRLRHNYKLGILSNAGADWVLRILGPTNADMFDDILLSYQVGYIKPEAEIYKLSAKNLNVNPKECVFIDDILKFCEGAETAGMKAIWYQDFKQTRQELERILSSGR